MNLVDEQNGVRLAAEPLEHLFDALLEVAAISRSGEQRSKIERKHLRAFQDVRYLAFVNPERQTFSERCLADARLADEQRVVLPASAQHLNHSLELETTSDERIDLPRGRASDKVRGVGLERIGRRGRTRRFLAGRCGCGAPWTHAK